MTLFCSACGDIVVVVYPCKFIFPNETFLDLNICLDCMDHGILKIDFKRKRLVAKVKAELNWIAKWRKGGD